MKPQAHALIEHLMSGGTVTRESAWQDFRIQNITARISELTALGYDIVKTPCKAIMDGREIRLSSWKLRESSRLATGCYVKIIKDSGTFVSLLGKTGVVQSLDLLEAKACVFIEGIGYRALTFSHLERLASFPVGARVGIKAEPYIVLEYHPSVESYTLASASPDQTIVAHKNLVEAVR